MTKRVVKVDAGASPASTGAYQKFRCPNEKCTRVEMGGHAPFYSTCPDCFMPAGQFVLVQAKGGSKGK